MHTGFIPVCNLGLFNDTATKFWMGSLNGLCHNYPVLSQPHKHDFYAFIVVDKGEADVHIDGQKINATTAGVIIIKPGCITTIAVTEETQGTIICFAEEFFSLRYNNNILNQFSFLKREASPFTGLDNDQSAKLARLLASLSEEYLQQKRESEKVMRSYLNIFLFEVERLYNPADAVKTSSLRQEKLHHFQQLVDRNFKEKKLPSDYAEMLNVSPNYLNKMCKEETGQTAGELIRSHVAVEARRLLHYTNFSVKEIADKLGFGHSSYFVTFFKKQTLQTPELFRKNQNA